MYNLYPFTRPRLAGCFCSAVLQLVFFIHIAQMHEHFFSTGSIY
jgi:hypothetical protein